MTEIFFTTKNIKFAKPFDGNMDSFKKRADAFLDALPNFVQEINNIKSDLDNL